MPISTMKSGMRGRVSSTVRPEIQSCHHITSDDQRRRDDGLHELRQVAAEVRLERVEPAPGGDGERGRVAAPSQSGPSVADRLRRALARSCVCTRAAARAATASRAQSSTARAATTTASATSVAARSAGGIPSIAPTIARVSSHANATMTTVWQDADRRDRHEEAARRARVPQQSRVDRAASACGARVGVTGI